MTTSQLYTLIVLIFLVTVYGAVLVSDGDNKKGRKALASQGYTHVRFLGIPWFACSDSDSHFTSKRFVAELNGKQVEGILCCGLILKSCTIRF